MKRMLYIILALMLAFGGVAGLLLVQHSQPVKAVGTTLTVTTNSDSGDDATIGADLGADTDDGDGLSLREALNWAVAGDTVTFDGSLSGQTVTLSGTQLTIDKDITLDGDLDDNGTPDIAISGNHTSRVIYTTGLTAAARLEGLTIRDGMTTLPDFGGSGMFIRLGNSPTINNCIFTGNSGSVLRTHGRTDEGICYPTITNCIFTGNSAGERGTIKVGYDSHPIITNCTFAGNTGGYCFLELDSDCTVNITNCIFWGNTGVVVGAKVVVTYSDVQGGCTGTGNINTDPLFVNAAGGDFHLQSEAGHWTSNDWVLDSQTSPCIDAGDTASAYGNEPAPNGGRVNMGTYGNTAQASKHPPTMTVTTNSDAGDDATTGASLATDTADGSGLSLREALNWAVAGDTVTFDGSLSGQTVTLSGTQLTIDKDITLDGDLDDNGTPDITISGNNTSRVINATGLTAAARLEGFTITNGAADAGGGMYNTHSSPTITNCVFSGNLADAGGGMYNNSSPTITNCTFSGNSATLSGGGMFHSVGSTAMVTNCTFSGNSATLSGGGIYHLGQETLTVTNCILWGDTPEEMRSASALVTYCDVQGRYFGTGNIDADPLFFDPANNDYHLRPGSPCIDAGNDEASVIPATDFDNDPRIMGAAVDMGVDEFLPAPEAWVDDDWTGKTFKEQVDGHTFGIDAFATIQDGIYAVISGNTVNVAAGTYSENVTIGKGLTLQSVSVSIIDGGGSGTAVTISASGVVITGFTIQNAETGISVTSGAENVINWCNIINNTTWGLNNTSGNLVTAENNWWGNASGPEDPAAYEATGYQAYGNAVSGNVTYNPWLLTEVDPADMPTTYQKTLALKDGWTLISTDALVEENRAWQGTILAYKYTSAGFVDATLADLKPLTAIYMKTDSGGGVGFNYAEVAPAVYAKDLEAGWNLISIPSTVADTGAILSPLRYVTIGTQQGIGLSTLVSQGDYNQFSDSFYLATLTDADWDALLPLDPFDGYWAYMNAAKTFEVIPD